MTLAEMKEKYGKEADALSTPGASNDPFYDERLNALFQLAESIHDKKREARHLTWFGVKV